MTADNPKPAYPPDPTPGKDYYYAVEPNQMTYIDGQGVLKTIHIPKGRNQEARQYFLNKNWEALAQFSEWSTSSKVHDQTWDTH